MWYNAATGLECSEFTPGQGLGTWLRAEDGALFREGETVWATWEEARDARVKELLGMVMELVEAQPPEELRLPKLPPVPKPQTPGSTWREVVNAYTRKRST